IFGELGGGVGQAGTEFVPERGYMTVMRLEADSGNQAVIWLADSLGMSLVDAQGGAWIEGPALAFAWQAVNANSLFPLLREGGGVYQARLLVPDVTVLQPPTP